MSELQINYQNLKPSPFNTYPIINIDDLKNSILAYGLLTPLSVIGPYEDGTYRILSGERRWTAITNLINDGENISTEIPCHILGDSEMDETEQKIILEAANLETREITNINEHRVRIMELLLQLYKQGDLGKKAIVTRASKYFKTSERYASSWRLVFMEGPEELKDLLRENKVNIQEAVDIVHLQDKENPEETKPFIEEAIERIESGEKTKEVIKDVKEKKEKKKESSANISLAELENMTFDDDFLLEDGNDGLKPLDDSGLFESILKHEEKDSSYDENYQNTLDTVVGWCQKMLSVTEPSQAEWEAINACRELSERFL